MGYWPSYSGIPPGCRSGYLSWLASGRSNPDAYIGYVFLFLYGLERRVLLDAETEAAARQELPAILAEVDRLLSIYSANGSFRGYAKAFRDMLACVVVGPSATTVPDAYQSGSELPVAIRLALGARALTEASVAPDLAFAWATSDPAVPLRTPAKRCRDEFRELFRIRYEAKFGEGLRLPYCKRTVRVEYRPSSSSFNRVFAVPTNLPDVAALVGPRRKITELVEEVTADLESYSRRLGPDPATADPMAAAAALPRELLRSHAPREVQELLQRLKQALEQRDPVVLGATEVLGPWLPEDGGSPSKKDAVAAAALLAHSGIGIEPDVRFGGSKLCASDKVAVFRLAEGDPEAPSAAYVAAALLLHLATLVATADGDVSMNEERHLQEHVARALHLEAGEKRRLAAHVACLLNDPPGMSGVKKRVEALSTEQRQSIGSFLVQVAAADGRISGAEVTTLTKLFRVLGLDPGAVHNELHALQVQPASDGPVSVRPARPTAPGRAIPPSPKTQEAPTHGLDMALVQAKLQESASVSALLSSIFAEGAEPEGPAADATSSDTAEGALAASLILLLRGLSKREIWTRAEYEALAGEHRLMPDGALDELNELAWEICDQALVEGDDPLEINMEVCKELLKA